LAVGFVAKMGDKLEAVYERLRAREMRAREEIRNSLACMHVAEIVAANLRGIDAAEVERWRLAGRIFSLGEPYQDCFPTFQFDGGQPKPIIRYILKLLKPEDSWYTAFWFYGANSWLDDGQPFLMVDSDPEQVLLAAEHANDEISD
jgi:hypothetical protein